jgi:hypothetical protein
MAGDVHAPRWLRDQLRPLGAAHRGLVVVLDPRQLVTAELLDGHGEIVTAADWWELRRIYEQRAREATPDPESPLVVLVHDPECRAERDLPYDIEGAATVIVIRAPVDEPYQRLLIDLPMAMADDAVRLLRGPSPDPLHALLQALYGITLRPDPADELDAVIRLRSDPHVPPSLWKLLRSRLRHQLAIAVASDPPDYAGLQQAWNEWLDRGDDSPNATLLGQFGPRIASLFAAGILRPAPRKATTLPSWTDIGASALEPAVVAAELLAAEPAPTPPTTATEWVQTATWWGAVRAAIASAAPAPAELMERARHRWQMLDDAFQPWLRANYSPLLLTASTRPLTLDKVAPFLARRRREARNRLLLVVIDGMGFAQWTAIQDVTALEVAEAGGCFAMLPTLTSVSRQAIFAGQLPRTFASSLWTTAHEPTRWLAFWEQEGVKPGSVRYIRLDGRTDADVPSLGSAQVVGMVVSAVDELIHSSVVLGDTQVADMVKFWARHGFLRGLVEQATRDGFEVWITADHGNIETEASVRVPEGLAVESAGMRVRLYANTTLRDASRAAGVIWEPLPGYPPDQHAPLFAQRRAGFHGTGTRVSHGGLSLDEIIVPLVRVRV